jgi:hypothetical protein
VRSRVVRAAHHAPADHHREGGDHQDRGKIPTHGGKLRAGLCCTGGDKTALGFAQPPRTSAGGDCQKTPASAPKDVELRRDEPARASTKQSPHVVSVWALLRVRPKRVIGPPVSPPVGVGGRDGNVEPKAMVRYSNAGWAKTSVFPLDLGHGRATDAVLQRRMQNLDRLLTLADECYAAARISSNPLMRAQFKAMGDDYLKQAEELQKNGVVVTLHFRRVNERTEFGPAVAAVSAGSFGPRVYTSQLLSRAPLLRLNDAGLCGRAAWNESLPEALDPASCSRMGRCNSIAEISSRAPRSCC